MSKNEKTKTVLPEVQERQPVEQGLAGYAQLPTSGSSDFCAYAGDRGFKAVHVDYQPKHTVRKQSDNTELASFESFTDARQYAEKSEYKCTVQRGGDFVCTEAGIAQLRKNKEISEAYEKHVAKNVLGEYEPLIRRVLGTLCDVDAWYADANAYSMALDLLTIFKQHKVKYEQPKRSNE